MIPAVGLTDIDLAGSLDFAAFGTAIGAVLVVAVPVGLLLLSVSQGWGWAKKFAKTK